MKSNEGYDKLSSSAFYEMVMQQPLHQAEAIYALLRHRLSHSLQHIYQNHGFGLNEDYEDTLDDFFLYLYEGSSGQREKPFAILESLRNKEKFFAWTLGTYRNFLLNKAKDEKKRKMLLASVRSFAKEEEQQWSEETMILLLADAIAYADQQFPLRNRFVFYRMLLTFLNHQRAIPQEIMAEAMEMHPVSYRVCNKRMKDRLGEFILELEAGHRLELDSPHILMCDRMIEGFNQLYQLLMVFYDNTLMQLPTAEKIQSLRQEYSQGKGMTMHERVLYEAHETTSIIQLFRALDIPPLPGKGHGLGPTHRQHNGLSAR